MINTTLGYILEFIAGGTVIAGMSFLAREVKPEYAGLLYALPLQFSLAALFTYLGSGRLTVQQLTQESLTYVLGYVGFILSFYILINRFGFWVSLTTSSLILITITSVPFLA